VASGGRLNIYVLLLLAWAGAVIGDNIGYVIGRTGGHRLMIRFGRRFGVTEDRFAAVEGFFTRYGSAVIIFARFVVVLRQFNGIVAGTLEMPWWRFLFFNALGAALWVGFWGGAAYWLGKKVFLYTDEFSEYEPYILGAIGIVVLAAAVYSYLWHRRGQRRRAQKKRDARAKLDETG
jgi:membrane protein DedA with SNARE-associated domain